MTIMTLLITAYVSGAAAFDRPENTIATPEMLAAYEAAARADATN
ncbi:hypothetical protein AADZ90_008610 [Aestuariibius sp. 2305UL40-4]